MILPDFMIRERGIFTPFHERSKTRGMSYGLSHAGYDVRVDLSDHEPNTDLTPDGSPLGIKGVVLQPGDFLLAATIEQFDMPVDLLGIVHDKSTWARQGLAAQNTVIEPGWRGFLTLELTNHGPAPIQVWHGDPIAQIVLHLLAARPESTYEGKYQGQEKGPQKARFEK